MNIFKGIVTKGNLITYYQWFDKQKEQVITSAEISIIISIK